MIYAALYVVFGVSLGFSLLLVWQQFEEARQVAEKEAASVEQLYRLAGQFPDPAGDRIRELAISYARAVVEEEWPLMEQGRVSPRAGGLSDELGERYAASSPAAARRRRSTLRH